MKKTVQDYVAGCQVCQQAKPEHVKLPGLLQPLPIPAGAWKVICMDFIEGLPLSHNHNVILVVIDKFTKYAHFVPLHHPFTALTVAHEFMSNVYKLHGLPQTIISDRDKIFTSRLWQELFRLSDTTLHMSSAYHPQTDGRSERLNQCLEAYLRCFVHSCPKKWYEWLPLAEYWYNTTYHSALDRTPFEALYGHPPRNFGIDTDSCASTDLETWLKERAAMTQLMQQHLVRAQQRMKHQADKRRSERTFAVGDQVFLKLQPYIQQSVAARGNQKLSFRFFGPYKVLKRIGEVAYKLELPASSQVHPVVHVSQLKRQVPATTQVHTSLNLCDPDPALAMCPQQFLSTAMITHGAATARRVQVQWSGRVKPMISWEDPADLHRRYPTASAWGQAVLKRRG